MHIKHFFVKRDTTYTNAQTSISQTIPYTECVYVCVCNGFFLQQQQQHHLPKMVFIFNLDDERGVVAVDCIFMLCFCLFIVTAVALQLESILSDICLPFSPHVCAHFVCTCSPLFVVSSFFHLLLHSFRSLLRHKMSDFCNLSMPASVFPHLYCN